MKGKITYAKRELPPTWNMIMIFLTWPHLYDLCFGLLGLKDGERDRERAGRREGQMLCVVRLREKTAKRERESEKGRTLRHLIRYYFQKKSTEIG